MSAARRRWLPIAAGTLLVAFLAGSWLAVHVLRGQVVQALGADAHVGAVRLGWGSVVIEDLRLPAPRSWPAPDALRAGRVVVTPDLRSLFSARVRVAAIRVEAPYLSLLRTANGRLRLLPGLLEQGSAPTASPGVPLAIGQVTVEGGTVEFFDASVRQPPHRLRLGEVEALLTDVELPALAAQSALRLQAVIAGVHTRGTALIEGEVVLATRESHLRTTLRGVDLRVLEPYLIKSRETGVRRGELDLDLDARVRGRRLRAPGRVELKHLELAPAGGLWPTFMGLPRKAVLAALADRDRRIALTFALDGDLDNPRFSLNETLSLRIAAGLAQGLGIGVAGLAKDVGSAVTGLLGSGEKRPAPGEAPP